MKIKLLLSILTIVTLIFESKITNAQAPTLGTAANFVLFTTDGAVSNSGISQYTGNVGAKIGSVTGFGNVNGEMHSGGAIANQAATDLLIAYNQLDAAIPDSTLSAVIGNGDTLFAGIYYIPEPASINLTLNLDAKGDPNAVFIFQIKGTMSSNTASNIKLLNGALACNIFWKVEGAVNLASGSNMKGSIVANNGAITMNTNDTLEGRALSTTGAILVSGVTAFTPIGCGSVVLDGPAAPIMGTTECYTIFSSNGSVTNTGITNVTGDIGTNVGLTTGFNPLNVNGEIHPSPDVSTAICAGDLNTMYNYLNAIPHDIELLYPALFGRNLILTPHTYLMNAAAVLTDTLFFDAQDNPDAIFIVRIIGALSTSTNARVRMINGAQAKNIFWNVDGAVEINDYSVFSGSIVSKGAIELKIGVNINGRTLTIGGAVNTAAITAIMPPGCPVCPEITTEPTNKTLCAGTPTSFSVVAKGTNLTYQWRKGNVNLTNTASMTGVTSDSLKFSTTTALDSSSFYHVIVSGDCLENDTSNYAVLVVNTPPLITSEPIDQLVCSGTSASFLVIAKGTNLTYQWKKGITNLSNSGNISGATSATLIVNPVSSADAVSNYNVMISGTCSPIATSNFAALVIDAPVAITSEPTNQTVCTGNSVSFTTIASGNNLSYQWQKGIVNLSNGGNISGATSSTLLINPATGADEATDYHVIVSGVCSSEDISVNASLVINTPPSITSQPNNQTVCEGLTVNFSATAIGTNLSYQWRKGNTNLTDVGNISGTTTANLNFNPVSVTDEGTDYNLVVTGTCSPISTSTLATLTINRLPIAAGTINGPASVCQNQSGVIYNVAPITHATSYIWVLSPGATITAGANTNTITVDFGVGAVSGNMTVQGSNNCGTGAVSEIFTINISTMSAGDAGTISGTNPVCQGQTLVAYNVPTIANATDYIWTLSPGASIIAGANTNSITVDFGANASNGNFTVQGSNGCGDGLISANFAITVNSTPIISTVADQVLCNNNSTNAINFNGTIPAATYNWVNDNPTIGLSANGTGNIPAFTAINTGTGIVVANITVTATTNLCSSEPISFTISVKEQPTSFASSNSPVCDDASIQLFAQTTSGATYNWTGPNAYTSADQNPIILNATNANTGTYSLIVTNNGCSSIASSVTVTVNPCGAADLSIVKTVDNSQPSIGETVVFTLIATNNGTLVASGVIVTDILQSGYTFVSSQSNEGFNDQTGIWNIGTLPVAATTQLTVTLRINASGNYVNTATIASDSLESNMLDNISSVTTYPSDFAISEGFSPNGDGINDLYVIRGIERFSNNTINIFNRWGDKVFEASPYKNTWNGEAQSGVYLSGNALPTGTYFYTLDLGDGTGIYKGIVYLNR